MSPGSHVRRRTANALLLIAALAPALPAQQPPSAGMPRAEKHESRQEIFQLEDAWRDALMKADTAAMDKLLADDYMAILPNGTLQSKEQALANLRNPTTHFSVITVSDRRVRFYGTTALVTSRVDVVGASPNGPISGGFRYTRVYVKDKQGSWKIVSFEASRIRGEHKKK
ncbi:MAG: nuclear transport factor 2 family protein [Terracidiphilus sp.]